MAAHTVTLDTNLVVSAFRSSLGASYRMMQLVEQGRLEIGLTVALVLEYESVCKRLIGDTWVTAEDVNTLIDSLCRVGRLSVVHYKIRPAAADPNDDLVVEAAVASGSEWIVTHNVRDLLDGASRYGIEVMTPAAALERMGEKR